MRRVTSYHVNSTPFLIKDKMKNSGVDLDNIYEVRSELGVYDSPHSRILIPIVSR